MEKLIENRIVKLHEDFLIIAEIAKSKDIEIKEYKKNFSQDLSIEKNVENFSNLVADFTLMSRDSQIIFTELLNMIKLYKDLNLSPLPEDIIDFYNKNEIFYPKTLFVVKGDGLVEKEEGSLQIERDKFIKSDYLKNLINAK